MSAHLCAVDREAPTRSAPRSFLPGRAPPRPRCSPQPNRSKSSHAQNPPIAPELQTRLGPSRSASATSSSRAPHSRRAIPIQKSFPQGTAKHFIRSSSAKYPTSPSRASAPALRYQSPSNPPSRTPPSRTNYPLTSGNGYYVLVARNVYGATHGRSSVPFNVEAGVSLLRMTLRPEDCLAFGRARSTALGRARYVAFEKARGCVGGEGLWVQLRGACLISSAYRGLVRTIAGEVCATTFCSALRLGRRFAGARQRADKARLQAGGGACLGSRVCHGLGWATARPVINFLRCCRARWRFAGR